MKISGDAVIHQFHKENSYCDLQSKCSNKSSDLFVCEGSISMPIFIWSELRRGRTWGRMSIFQVCLESPKDYYHLVLSFNGLTSSSIFIANAKVPNEVLLNA